MATYAIGDIHNSLNKLDGILEQISLSSTDNIILLGDIFDRGGAEPDPVGVYFRLSGLNSKVSWIRGNHDQLLAEYILNYYGTPEKKRRNLQPYRYNSLELMNSRLTEVDMLNIADLILRLPLQIELEIKSEKYLLAHAMTFNPTKGFKKPELYLEGVNSDKEYLEKGVEGYVSIVGHQDTSYQRKNPNGHFLDGVDSIWVNEKNNLYMIDCGCGLPKGRLACMCLETGERFYS